MVFFLAMMQCKDLVSIQINYVFQENFKLLASLLKHGNLFSKTDLLEQY